MKKVITFMLVFLLVLSVCSVSFAASGDDNTINGTWDNMPMLKYGYTGNAVRGLQQFLILMNYSSVGSIDGVIGDKTFAAMKSYQSIFGLTADGAIGPKTWAKMRSQLAQYDVGPTNYSNSVYTYPAQDRYLHQHSTSTSQGSVIGSWWVEYGDSYTRVKMCN